MISNFQGSINIHLILIINLNKLKKLKKIILVINSNLIKTPFSFSKIKKNVKLNASIFQSSLTANYWCLTSNLIILATKECLTNHFHHQNLNSNSQPSIKSSSISSKLLQKYQNNPIFLPQNKPKHNNHGNVPKPKIFLTQIKNYHQYYYNTHKKKII